MNKFMVFISILLLFIMVLIGVAFLTLLERKILSYIQIRKGPNKVSMVGLFQPISDAIKLFSKEQLMLNLSNYLIYYMSPVIMLMISLLMWIVVPYLYGGLLFIMGMMFFICCLSFSVYSLMFSGWSSNSNYAMIGSMRSVAQMISYEVSFIILMMSMMFLIEGFNLYNFYLNQEYLYFMILMFPLSLLFFLSSLAETNRTPFDFAEGESELVSGFNIEYGSGGFALIFLGEYSSILFMSFIFTLMFLGGNFYMFMFYIKVVFISFIYIWVRGTLPRYRYDKLMFLTWKGVLPVSLNYLLMIFSFKMALSP
uniref:NADH-ubiquinone oxidoreductase chain 1 n=1 Tax=Xenopsylla cheopis TaxID=163159 RepID=A0A8F5XNJ6_XENCH|nr:NADH dehydrogenase subunit 1 [Xenopsylla cheopis]